MKIEKKLFYFCSSYCPLQIRTLKTCNISISKTITACGLRFGQLIEDGGEIEKKVVIFLVFSSYCPLQIWTLKTCIQSKTNMARSFKLSHLIEDDE